MKEDFEYGALERKLDETKRAYQRALLAMVGVSALLLVRGEVKEHIGRMEGQDSIIGAETYDVNRDGIEDICLETNNRRKIIYLGDGKGHYERQNK